MLFSSFQGRRGSPGPLDNEYGGVGGGDHTLSIAGASGEVI